MTNKTFAVCTLGCKVNAYESECLAALFEKEGLTKVDFSERADIYLINTCSVTNTGDKKSRQAIHKARRQNPDAFIAVCGCYAQAKAEEVSLSGADLVAGTSDREKIVSRAMEGIGGSLVEDISKKREFEELSGKPVTERCRAYIKIQDGCNNFCSYCIIPYTRGRVRSRKQDSVINEAIRLKNEGFSEIVLAGIEVYSYGSDLGDTSLIDLLEELSSAVKILRIRLSSIDPRAFTDEFIKRLSRIPGLCRHFHISAQSGCDETLKRMNRPNTAEEFLEILKKIRAVMPDAAVTTDIITGFPGETEEEFLKTREFLKKAEFSRLHVFPYSERSGTRAAKMEQLPVHIRSERAKVLIEDGKGYAHAFSEKQLGKTLNVLAEYEKDGVYFGYSENYVRVGFRGTDIKVGEIYPVIAEKVFDDAAVSGKIVKEK